MTDANINAYERERIKMEFAVPLVRHLQNELGVEAVNKALKNWTREKTADAEAAESTRADMKELAEAADAYRACGFEHDVSELTDETFRYDVRRCRFAEMMEEFGARDLGPNLICNHDFSSALKGGARLERTQTIMKGCGHCNFHYTQK